MKNSPAPLILFVYNRPEHTAKTLTAIADMLQIEETDLYVFADGPKKDATENSREKINAVRKLAREFSNSRTTQVFSAKENKGLARSVIEGVGQVLQQHDSVVVLEDDLTPGKNLLVYMNNALEAYQEESEVMQVSAYDFPVRNGDFPREAYFSPLTTTWGWGTWKRVWDKIDFACPGYRALKTDPGLAKRFDVNNGYAYSKMLLQQVEGDNRISSWGICFYWNVFINDGKVLYPGYPLVLNEGWDGSGAHGDSYELFPVKDWDMNYKVAEFPLNIDVSETNFECVSLYFKSRLSLTKRIKSKVTHFIKTIYAAL